MLKFKGDKCQQLAALPPCFPPWHTNQRICFDAAIAKCIMYGPIAAYGWYHAAGYAHFLPVYPNRHVLQVHICMSARLHPAGAAVCTQRHSSQAIPPRSPLHGFTPWFAWRCKGRMAVCNLTYNLKYVKSIHKGQQAEAHTLDWESQGANAAGQSWPRLGLGQAQEVLVGQAPVWIVHTACSSKSSLVGAVHQHSSFCIVCMSTVALSLT